MPGPYDDELEADEEDERLALEADEESDRDAELEEIEDRYPEWSGTLRTHLHY